MLNRIFLIADTHFGHGKLTMLRGFETVEKHDRELVSCWNSTVKKNDTVWHLGDVYFGGRNNHTVLGALNGIKRLVLGNHDTYPLEIYQQYFRRIYGAATLRGWVLTHIPVHPQQLETRFQGNIHGHLHTARLDDPRYICVSVEQTGLGPVLLDEVLA
ncbi:MAG: metallophosphoesterase [Nitrososphaera sp.]